MNKNLKKALSILILLTGLLKAQSFDAGLWTAVSESAIPRTGVRQIIPQKYLSYRLNAAALKDKLFTAAQDRNVLIDQSNCIVSLPLPNGTVQRFRVVESPVMAPELAAAFPQIKTFSVKGIDDVYANGKIDWTEFGFHAMIRTVNGDFFIDPFCVGNISDYQIYYTSDFEKAPAQRITEEVVIVEPEAGPTTPQKKEGLGSTAGSKPGAICVGAQLRTYRLAVACTHQYAIAATGLAAPTVAQTLAKVVTSVNRVDGVYETEVAVKLVLVPSTTLVLYTTLANDSFTGTANSNSGQLLGLSQTIITASIGTANFDIGHTFSTGGGGLATLGCVCKSSSKAQGITGSASPVGDPYDIDYVAHEMGHQFGGNHTFNATTGSCSGNRNGPTSMEPGSGVTIMAYAGICSSNNVAGNSIAYFHGISYDEIVNYTNSGAGSSCPVITGSGNQAPIVTGSGNYAIPKSTPFSLTGSATDPDGDPVTYSWEEMDAGSAGGNWNSGQRPYFRSYVPVTTPTRLFPRASVVFNGNYTGTVGEYLPGIAQTLNFRLTARDNKMGGGGVCYDETQIVVDTAGPFVVLYPSATGIVWGVNRLETIIWDPAYTDQPPVSCDSVRILISYNNGTNYSVLVNSAPNFGWQQITVPNLTTTINTCRIRVEGKGNIFYDIGNNNFTISFDPTVGVRKISQNNPVGLSVWPNPANDQLNFGVSNLNSAGITQVILMDLLGKTMLENSYVNKSQLKETLDISQLSKGVYFIKVINDTKQSVYRLVKD
ncbi:MAG: M12 family metallo-peptidase [bacterium]|nr:M12 family metallo-peptidase [bacterium]